MTHWRSIVDQLGADEIALLESDERAGTDAETLLFIARDFAYENLEAMLLT